MKNDPEAIADRLREISESNYGLGGFGISEIRKIADRAADTIEDQSRRLKAIVAAVDAAREGESK
jgi:nucleoside-triphosphatase THEP1